MAGWVALEKMVMLVLLMLVGFAAAKAQWVDSAFSQKTSRLVANVFIVATILSSLWASRWWRPCLGRAPFSAPP